MNSWHAPVAISETITAPRHRRYSWQQLWHFSNKIEQPGVNVAGSTSEVEGLERNCGLEDEQHSSASHTGRYRDKSRWWRGGAVNLEALPPRLPTDTSRGPIRKAPVQDHVAKAFARDRKAEQGTKESCMQGFLRRTEARGLPPSFYSVRTKVLLHWYGMRRPRANTQSFQSL